MPTLLPILVILVFLSIYLFLFIRSNEGELTNAEVQFKSTIDQLEVEVGAGDSSTAALNNLKMK